MAGSKLVCMSARSGKKVLRLEVRMCGVEQRTRFRLFRAIELMYRAMLKVGGGVWPIVCTSVGILKVFGGCQRPRSESVRRQAPADRSLSR